MQINLDYIKNLASNREGVDVEFKETTGQLSRGMESLCGMLNGNGGIVVFGVSNCGKVIGQEIGDKTTREIGEALKKFDPIVNIQPIYVPIPDTTKSVIIFISDGLECEKPYMWDGKPYQRHDSVTTIMPKERFVRLHELQSGLTYKWEKEIVPEPERCKLDDNLIKNVVNGAIRRGRLSQFAVNDDTQTILTRLKLVRVKKLCNAAMVLFGKDMIDYPQCMIRMARFRGTTRKEFIDNQQFEGNIFEMVSQAMAFFFKHLSLSGTTHGKIEREDELEVPYDALREAVVNSLCHRAWQYESSTVGVAIYDDRIEVENAGHFPANISPVRLSNNERNNDENMSLPPNPIIANVMFLGGLIEHWGRGLSLMSTECERVGLSQPRIIENGNMVKVIFQRPDGNNRKIVGHKPDTSRTQAGHKPDTSRTQAGHKPDTSFTCDIQGNKYGTNILRLINIIGENWYSTNDLLSLMGFKSRSSFSRNYLAPSLERDLVKLEDPANPTSPNQRYGLTLKGKAVYYNEK